MKGLIFAIEEFAVYDGPGIRVNVFFKGCPLRCRWCHNPEGLSPRRQILRSPNGCIGCGKCRDACPKPEECLLCGACLRACPRGLIRVGGDEWESDALAARILRLKPILEKGGGVTFSGGEPFEQAQALLPLAAELKAQGYHLMAFSGYTFEQLREKSECRALLEKLDLLVDGPFLEAQKSLDLRFRGSRNQRILNMSSTRENGWNAVLDALNEAVER